MNRYMEMDIKPLKTAKNSHENNAVPLNDCGIARSADILAFHCSLDRHFDCDHNFSGECHPFYELVYVEEGTVGIAGFAMLRISAETTSTAFFSKFNRIKE